MPSLDFHRRRREAFFDAFGTPTLLMAGGWRSRNYPANPYPYRADSNFLYFFANPEPDSAAFFDPETRRVVLFLPARTASDALWHGSLPSFEEMQAAHGVDEVRPLSDLAKGVMELAGGRSVATLAVADSKATTKAALICGFEPQFDNEELFGHPELISAIASLRICKEPEEIEEMRRTARITDAAHRAAMARTRAGGTEQELVGAVEGTFADHGCVPAYNTILSVRGEVLHNHDHGNTLRDGDLVLLDAGAEAASGYCSDVTRTWPVSGRFEGVAAEVYDIVLAAEVAAIEAVKPGVRYRDLHLTSARVLAEGLTGLGLLRGDASALVEVGAHALFFPHGVGHLIGLDVHDMEAFGDRVHYPDDRKRSGQFGLGYLRLDVDVQPGMAFTIEPGIYFVPAILRDPDFREQFEAHVDFAQCEKFLTMNDGRGFGGVRIEDDVLATETGHEVLTAAVPKDRAAVEAQIGTA